MSIFNIDYYWNKTKKWFDHISDEKVFSLFPLHYEQKDIFTKKIISLLPKNEFNIIQNEIKDLLFSFFELDSFSILFPKIKNIINIIFQEEYFHHLFQYDDHLIRIISPILCCIIFIYINTFDIEITEKIFSSMDIIFLQFFIISYCIIDDCMDDIKNNYHYKKKFMKWFLHIVNHPNDNISLNNLENIWQCIIFKKYFLLFREKYPYDENKEIYTYIQFMIKILIETDKIQKNNTITYDEILEVTFKKAYVVLFFITMFINIKNKYKKIDFLCKFIFITQLYDDANDIERDIIEKNYTFFHLPNSIIYDFNEHLKKLYNASILLINELNDPNNKIKKIYMNNWKYSLLYLFYLHYDKLNNEHITIFNEHLPFHNEVLNYFNKNTYNPFTDNIIINKIIKND